MTAFHIAAPTTTPSSIEELRALRAEGPGDDFAAFERRVHALVMGLEAEVLGEALGRLDIDAPAVRVGDTEYRRVVRCSASYLTRGGEVRVERSLYRAPGASRAICPMELRAGIVESFWSPESASLATWAVAHMTPQEACELFGRSGGMAPSRSALDRLPKALGDRWEEQRPRFEEVVRADE